MKTNEDLNFDTFNLENDFKIEYEAPLELTQDEYLYKTRSFFNELMKIYSSSFINDENSEEGENILDTDLFVEKFEELIFDSSHDIFSLMECIIKK